MAHMEDCPFCAAPTDQLIVWGDCTDLSKRCRVFVSEYQAPDGWREIWAKSTTSSLTKETGAKTIVEALFVIDT
jgi:hypothetical protein